jgi:trans-aconitate 2-methyltransferase
MPPRVDDPNLAAAHAPDHAYAFGDSATAAERLELLARTFETSSRAFIRLAAPLREPERVIDLGCGPGHTTALLADLFANSSVLGIDCSPAFVELARACAGARTSFVCADATQLPLPRATADVLYARYLLAHLEEPERTVVAWLSALRPGGILLVEEDEWIHSEDPVLAEYCALVIGLVTHHGGELLVGPRLARMALPSDCRVRVSRVEAYRVPVPAAAALFAMNFATWRTDPWIVRNHTPAALDALGRGLDQARRRGIGTVTFGLRQLAIRRRPEVAGPAA